MSDRTTMKQTVEQIAFADSTYWDDGWQFADHLQQKARNGLARRESENPRATLLTHSYPLIDGRKVRHTHVVKP